MPAARTSAPRRRSAAWGSRRTRACLSSPGGRRWASSAWATSAGGDGIRGGWRRWPSWRSSRSPRSSAAAPARSWPRPKPSSGRSWSSRWWASTWCRTAWSAMPTRASPRCSRPRPGGSTGRARTRSCSIRTTASGWATSCAGAWAATRTAPAPSSAAFAWTAAPCTWRCTAAAPSWTAAPR